MVIANPHLVFHVFGLQAEPDSFGLRFLQVVLQLPYLLEQLLQAVLILIVFLNLDLDLLVSSLRMRSIHRDIFQVNFLFPRGYVDGRPGLHLLAYKCLRLDVFRFFHDLALAFNDSFLFNYDGLLK